MIFPEQYRLMGKPGGSGAFCFKKNGVQYRMVASNEQMWDHVSVTLDRKRCPDWDEMCMIKSLFWNDNETVVQYHPAKEHYVNNHEYCLHLWKQQGVDILLPPMDFIGVR